jgi:hypothetical protein
MISSLPINDSSQTYICWLAARRTQARIHPLNLRTTALANTVTTHNSLVGTDLLILLVF